jgi:A/G-specific adenine glycosylase
MSLSATRAPTKRSRRQAGAPAAAAGPDPALLLAWFDRHARRLPWRARPGEAVDPYRVWLSEIMLQQTTVKTVGPYFARFLARWPDVTALAAAPLDDVLKAWAGLGYYARARNLHACAQAVAGRHGGRFPDDERALRALPGIGSYTAAAIAAIAFGRRAAPVDGNIERVVARLNAVAEALPAAKPRIAALAAALVPAQRPGDFVQAMMDLGATICTPQRPACALCPFSSACAGRREGDPTRYPRKAPKTPGRRRRGAAFWVVRGDGFALVRTRPPRGLLGGMTELPTSAWSHDFDPADAVAEAPPLGQGRRKAAWRRLPGSVTHVFTHFPLELVVYAATVPPGTPAPAGARWVALARLAEEALPTVMRKVAAHALAAGQAPVARPEPFSESATIG